MIFRLVFYVLGVMVRAGASFHSVHVSVYIEALKFTVDCRRGGWYWTNVASTFVVLAVNKHCVDRMGPYMVNDSGKSFKCAGTLSVDRTYVHGMDGISTINVLSTIP